MTYEIIVVTRQIFIYLYLLDHETAKIANEIAKIPKSVKRVVFYIQKTGFFSS